MPSNPQFLRKLDDSDPRLLVSVCAVCGKMLGVAASPRILNIVEKAHRCISISPYWQRVSKPA